MPAPPPAAVTAWRRSWDGPPLPSRQMPTITSRLGIAHATPISYCRLGVGPKSASHSPLVLQAKVAGVLLAASGQDVGNEWDRLHKPACPQF